jgi:hypothetical protein
LAELRARRGEDRLDIGRREREREIAAERPEDPVRAAYAAARAPVRRTDVNVASAEEVMSSEDGEQRREHRARSA